ncbi:MAG: transcriptional regulator, partial [Actinobacteria bacterium]|nr:transcriptional regulator [Actinomycetota bacterium]
MADVTGWTGRKACALQTALRLSQEAFAARLGISARTVAAWHKKPDIKPQSEMQQVLDTALEQASPSAVVRFAELTGVSADQPKPDTTDADRRLSDDPHICAALDWLDRHAGREPGASRWDVAARLHQLDVRRLLDRGSRRGRVGQRDVARALASYYRHPPLYTARCGEVEVGTSILSRPDWLDLDCPLRAANDQLRFTMAPEPATGLLDGPGADAAANRLAESLVLGVRVVDNPIYRLTGIDVRDQLIGGSVAVAPFVEYALTMDLLESELIDDKSAGRGDHSLPLRDRYMPDLDAVLDVSGRLCAGGALALCAIARPADPFRGYADYLLLVQERSGHVLNAARKLAVIPKGFHQPLTDLRADTQVGLSIRREMEEELFGRPDIDSTLGPQRSADPMHPSRMTEPMRWLIDEPGRLRMECTGFGLNLVSGNYEFTCLIVIEDEEFWLRYGGVVEANWESSTLRRYSTQDP